MRLLLAVTTLPFLLSPHLGAQAVETAHERLRAGFYGLVSSVNPDFNGSSRAVGVTLGGTLDGIRVLPYTDLGLDVRGALSHSNVINEMSLAGGPRISFNRYRLQPYAEYQIGLGRGNFNLSTGSNYTHDFSVLQGYGGGVNFRLSRDFDLSADAQRQRWRFTHLAPYFHPVQVGIGVRYRLHLHSRTGPQ